MTCRISGDSEEHPHVTDEDGERLLLFVLALAQTMFSSDLLFVRNRLKKRIAEGL